MVQINEAQIIFKAQIERKIPISYSKVDEKLIDAVNDNNLTDVNYYLEQEGANPNFADNWSIKIASEKGYTEIVKLLVKYSADIRTNDDYCFCWSAINGHKEVVDFCLDNGADIHVNNDYALRHAARRGELEMVKYLFEKGCDINLIKECENKNVNAWVNMMVFMNDLESKEEKSKKVKI